ncbi:MAG: DUF4340 domain-containing protein [Planctomycetota bacterium]
MNKSNLILGGILVVLVGIWLLKRDGDFETSSAQAPLLFPDFNKEAVDGIRIEGGWKGMTYEYKLVGSAWTLASAGGFPVNAAEAQNFVDAVARMRRDNLVGESSELRADSRTDEKMGRKISILRQGEPMAEFYLGKHPKGEWQAYFIRRADEEQIYRSKTATKDDMGDDTPARTPAFDWAQYSNNVYKFADTQIWNLNDGDIREMWLERPGDSFSVKLKRAEEDSWMLIEKEGAEPVKADTSAVEGITSQLNYLPFEEVVGAFDDPEARAKWGLDKPVITLVMTLRKKVEKKEDEAKPDGEEKKEGEEEKDEKADEPEYVTFTRTITVGNKVKLPRSYKDEEGKTDDQEFYAVKVSGELPNQERAPFIYLVDDFKIGPLKTALEDLRLKEEEKEPAEGEGEGDTKPAEEDGEDKKPAEESGKPEEDETSKPSEEENKPEEEKKPAENKPEKTQPEKTEPEKTEPEKTEPAGEPK